MQGISSEDDQLMIDDSSTYGSACDTGNLVLVVSSPSIQLPMTILMARVPLSVTQLIMVLPSFVPNLKFLFSKANSGLNAEGLKSLFIPFVFQDICFFAILPSI